MPLLAIIVIVSLVIVLALAFAFYPATRARTEERIIALADEQSHLMESVRGAQTIKLRLKLRARPHGATAMPRSSTAPSRLAGSRSRWAFCSRR